jgi:hypothetical protein
MKVIEAKCKKRNEISPRQMYEEICSHQKDRKILMRLLESLTNDRDA